MTESKIVKFFNNLMWCTLYLLPLIVFIIMTCKNGTLANFADVFGAIGCGMTNDNIVYTAFDSIFGATGVLPLFSGNSVLMFATYYASCYLLHFIVDVVLWLVRWAHDLMHKGGKNLW